MTTRLARCVYATLLTGLALAWVGASTVQAQEQFFTQSGGRGLQNAKTNARLSKVEGDVDVLNVEMAKVKPHAKAELGNCPDAGDKLRYTGTNWVCEQETDPTVQAFAKKALPTCSGTSIIGVVGGEFGCVNSGFVSDEVDPTVQGFAKTPLPACGAEQVLSTTGSGALTCMTDQKGLTRETDPMVHEFARTDTAPSVPNCAANEVLTMNGGRLKCQVDTVGITQEADPFTADFARKDIAGYTLAACTAGQVLQAVTESSKVILKCVPGGTALSESLALNDLSDVDTAAQASSTVLMFNGTQWVAHDELDPTVQSWAKTPLSNCGAGQVLTIQSGNLACVDDAGGAAAPLTFAGLSDVAVSGTTTGQFVKYNGTKWVPGTVEDFAQTVLPTCGTGQVLTGDGDTLSCTDDAGGASDPLDLVELGDVRTGVNTVLSPNDKEFLRWNAGTSKWVAVRDITAVSQTASAWCYYDGTNIKCDRGAPTQCGAGDVLSWNAAGSSFGCVSGTTALGLGTMAYQNSNAVSVTGGMINGTTIGTVTPDVGRFTNLFVTGNFYVSGTQSIDGVSFLNGGVQATGTVTATHFVGDGSGITNINTSNIGAAGAVGDVQIKGVGGDISATNRLNWSEANRNLGVSGTLQVAGTGAETCDTAAQGKVRIVDVGASDVRMQFCR